jgi:hypothetical protein
LCGGIIASASGHGRNGQLYRAVFIQWVVVEVSHDWALPRIVLVSNHRGAAPVTFLQKHVDDDIGGGDKRIVRR